MGGASRWWLHHSLTSLAADLKKLGAQLILRRGRADVVITELLRETGAASLHWNRCYEPHAIARDTSIKKSLTENGIAAESYNGALLAEPWTVRTKQDGPFKVFTPFWNAIRERSPERPTLAPESLRVRLRRSDRPRGLETAAGAARLGGRPARNLASR